MTSRKAAAPLVGPDGARQTRLNRTVVTAGLFCLFGLVYLLTPYWMLPEPTWQRLCCAAVTLAAGVLWAWLAAGNVEIRLRRGDCRLLLGVGALGAALNALALAADLPWRGDEDHHFKTSAMLAEVLKSCWHVVLGCVAVVVGAAMLGRRLERRHRWVLLSALALVGAGLVVAVWWLRPPFVMDLVTRYPAFTNWLAAGPVAAGSLVARRVPEPVFRIVPALSAVLLAWYCARRTALPAVGRLVYAVAVLSVPVVFYYSSILYLEMPAILCMTIVCLDAEDLLKAPLGELRDRPQWIALVLVGFIKETAVAFLGAFVLCRLAFRLRAVWAGPRRLRAALQEAGVLFCVLLPYAAYFVYRTYFAAVPRSFQPRAAGLADVGAYGTLLRAMWDQFGPAALAFPVGLLLLWIRRPDPRPRPRASPAASRRSGSAAMISLAFVAWAALHLMDDPRYVGYSRFVLMFAPVVLAGAHELVVLAADRLRAVAVAALAVIAGVNLLMSPVHLDGAKTPGWGQYRDDTSEHYYPYRSALRYVMDSYPSDRTLLAGLTYQYYHEYYTGQTDRFARMLRHYREEPADLTHAMLVARANGFSHVLYHLSGPSVPRPVQDTGFVQDRVFRNSAHGLVLYSLGAGPIGAR